MKFKKNDPVTVVSSGRPAVVLEYIKVCSEESYIHGDTVRAVIRYEDDPDRYNVAFVKDDGLIARELEKTDGLWIDAEEHFRIKGRGDIFLVKRSKYPLINFNKLIGSNIMIDGGKRKLLSIEYSQKMDQVSDEVGLVTINTDE